MLSEAIARVLPELRAEAEARMTSRCTIRRTSGATTTNPDGFEVPAWTDVLIDVPFRLGGSGGASASRRVTIGESEVELAVRVGHFPADTEGLADSDLIEVTEGENAGVVLRIVEASWQDQATARRVPVVEVTRPEEWA
jgi:hypothetical protein